MVQKIVAGTILFPDFNRLGLDLNVNVFNLQTVVIALDQRHRQPLLDLEIRMT